ncbi:MAG: hypothetical protein ACU833_08995 [Gammaproteobacteria bacterium]
MCDKPKFSRFNPAHLEEVEPGAEFSFNGTGNVAANSVEVTVKGIKVDLQVEDKEFFYRFSGRLPESLKGTFARIDIKGNDKLGCKGSDGWLVKITGGAKDETTGNSGLEANDENVSVKANSGED